MRKITEKVVEAFIAGRKCKVGNTTTDGVVLRLHGNLIAEKRPDGAIVATLAGWPTVTTRERLNGLSELLGLGRLFCQINHGQWCGLKEIGPNETVTLVEAKNWEVAYV